MVNFCDFWLPPLPPIPLTTTSAKRARISWWCEAIDTNFVATFGKLWPSVWSPVEYCNMTWRIYGANDSILLLYCRETIASYCCVPGTSLLDWSTNRHDQLRFCVTWTNCVFNSKIVERRIMHAPYSFPKHILWSMQFLLHCHIEFASDLASNFIPVKFF